MTILYGLLIAIAVTAICALVLLKLNDVRFTIVTAIIGVVLLAFLTFENSRLIKDIQQRNKVDDILEWVETALVTANVVMPDEVQDYTFGPLEAHGIVMAVKGFDVLNHSSYASYIEASDFTGKSWTSLSEIIKKVIRKESAKKIGFRIGWCVLAVVVAMVLMAFIGKQNLSRKSSSSYSEMSATDYDDFYSGDSYSDF
ncbi:MAG: hypothetical protein IJT51_00895 [Bacteroidales bacterium]|nr:hypothetical protein [Bacteroidales bacterium]